MAHSTPYSSSSTHFNEVAIADIGPFQIVVLTTTRTVNRQIFSAQVLIPERLYQSQGWLIYNHQIIACLNGLILGSVFPDDSPFRLIRRLTPSVPIAFEVQSSRPLPSQVSSHASFSCELKGADFPFHSVFRRILPRFVRIYPLDKQRSLIKQGEQMLADEVVFLTENRTSLQKGPFYQKNWDYNIS